jgi:hypothetical protein
VKKNAALRNLFGPKEIQLPGRWRRLNKNNVMIFAHTKRCLKYHTKEGELGVALCTFGGEKKNLRGFYGET